MATDWTSFTKSITVKTSREKLYHAFATRASMESWFLRNCDYRNSLGTSLSPESFAKAGDVYTWLWFGYSDDTKEHREIIQANGYDFF